LDKVSGKQYIYIVQSSLELTKCKIGKTNDLERRLSEYNNMTGKSKENVYKYLFTCEVKDMTKVENAIKRKYGTLREEKSHEIYFYNNDLFQHYVEFIKTHELFVKEIFIEPPQKVQKVQIVERVTPTLKERGIKPKDVLQKAQKANNDEFYTIYEDIEKELSMYDKNIWKDKVVFCNCDDAVDNESINTSEFALYFLHYFEEVGLIKLICTHYSGALDLFNQGA
jgi:predicted GIY-YIG superfamily endonuclease